MTNWITDEFGLRTFTHEGWTVRIWSPEWRVRISVETPHSDAEVEVDEVGIWVNGEESGGWDRRPRAFTIPWPVIGDIIEARAIVG